MKKCKFRGASKAKINIIIWGKMQIECFIFGTYLPNTYIHLKINMGFFFAFTEKCKNQFGFCGTCDPWNCPARECDED